MTIKYSGDNITFSDSSIQSTAATGFGFKNRIINGAMGISQRGTSFTTTSSPTYTLDRWRAVYDATSKFTVAQTPSATETGYATRLNAGFTNYLAVTSSSAYTATAAQAFLLEQIIEGFNVADLAWGTSNAKTVTLGFWVNASLTGTYAGCLENGSTRSYVFTYTVNSSNTWEYKTITVAGDTSASWASDASTTNGLGMRVRFDLGSGSNFQATANTWSSGDKFTTAGAVSVVGTNGATFYITGVQLEKGSTATSFDYRPYSTELALCQRYCLVYSNAADGACRAFGFNYTTTSALAQFYFPVQTRVAPTGISASTVSNFTLYSAGTSFAISAIALDNSSNKTANVTVTSSGLTQGGGCILGFQTTGNKLEFTGMEL